MLKKIVLLISFLLLISCGSTKNNLIIPKNAPEWVINTPLNNSNYIGIGKVSKTSIDYREKAQKMALTEISNSISVTVSTNNSLNVFQYDDTFNEFYQMNSMISSASFLEGYEIVDVFETDDFYYTYISLSKQKHLQLKKARINKALETSIFKFEYAKKLIAEKNFTEAIKQQILALEDISEFLNEDLRYNDNQLDKPYVSHLMNTIFNNLDQILIVYPVNQLQIKHAFDAQEILIQPVSIQSQNKNLSNIPVSFLYSWQPGQSLDLVSENNGTISLKISRNCSKNISEKITAFLDVNSLVKNLSQNLIVHKIFQNYKSKKFDLLITKQLPTIEFEMYVLDDSKKSILTVEDEFFQKFINDNFTLASKKNIKDYTITIESEKLDNLEVNNKISTKLESRIRIVNSKNQIVYQETIYNIIGIGSSHELAERDAIQSLINKIKIVNYNAMVQSML